MANRMTNMRLCLHNSQVLEQVMKIESTIKICKSILSAIAIYITTIIRVENVTFE